MEHRRLGRSGVKVSVLSFGSWVSFDDQLDDDDALLCMQAAWDAGVTFFDNAEAYAGGESERIMGRCFERLGWDRRTYTVSTKLYWGLVDGPNSRFTLNRKYLLDAMDRSLERFGLDFVDLLYCHRSDPETPMEEVVWTMSDIVASGRATYWGTSEWSAAEIREAWDIADRHHLRKPVVEQPQYNLLCRRQVEEEYADLYDDIGLGLTTWSPLSSGLLTGKYRDGVPDDSRAALRGYKFVRDRVTDPDQQARTESLRPIAEGLGCTMAQLAIAWCTLNPNVSSVITGASRLSQVHENMAALDFVEALDEEVVRRIDTAVQGAYTDS